MEQMEMFEAGWSDRGRKRATHSVRTVPWAISVHGPKHMTLCSSKFKGVSR